jgi:hypothetical protein
VIVVCRQRISLGRVHAGRTIQVHVSEHTLAVELDDDTRTIRRTTKHPLRTIKGERPTQRSLQAKQTELSASADREKS